MTRRIGIFLLGTAIVLLSFSAWADGNGMWTGLGKTSDWSDAGNWSGGAYPQSLNRALFFREPEQTAPALLTATNDVMCMYIQIPERAGASGNDSLPDPLSVTLKGPMNLTLSPTCWCAIDHSAGRRLVFDGVTVPTCGGLRTRGELIFCNKTTLSTDQANDEGTFATAGARLVVDDSELCLKSLRTAYEPTLRFSVRHGGFFRLDTLWGVVGWPAEWQASVVDGTVVTPASYDVFNAGLIPERTGSLIVRRSGSSAFKPSVAYDDHHRWGGDVYLTNGVDAAMSITNVASFYGRGRLFANTLKYLKTGSTLTLDLAEINLGKTITIEDWGHLSCYDFSGTRIGGFGNWRSGEQPDAYYWMIMRGDITFDTCDCFDHLTKHTYWMKWMYLQPRSSLSYLGGGSVTNSVDLLPVRLAGLTVGDATTAVFSALPNKKRLAVQNLNLRSGSDLTLPSIVNAPAVCGSACVDPSARLRMALPATLEDQVYPVWCSLENSVPTEVLDIGTLPDGWGLKTVAGSAYITNGKHVYEAWDVWTGKKSGLWSDAENWVVGSSQGAPKTPNRVARFHGETHTVVTNDVDDVEVKHLRVESASAPFVLTGKPIALTSTDTGADSTIYHLSPFPFVLETAITSTQELFTICTSLADAPVVFRGGLHAPKALIDVYGNAVADGAVTAAQFGFRGDNSGNVFTVRRGATASFTAQSAQVDKAGMLWVDAGATMSVAGSLRWSVANEHRIDGLLDITGSLGGTASQGYFGTGVVQVAATTQDSSESATVRIGEGITLKPVSWGALPIELASSATLGAAADWSYAVQDGLKIAGLGAVLTVDPGAYDITVSAPLVGEDFDIVKKGSGCLTLASTNALKGFVTVEAGALAWNGDQSFARLTVRPDATLKFGSKDGVIAKETLKNKCFKAIASPSHDLIYCTA